MFPKGITILSWVTGMEHKNICRILIGLIINLPLLHGQASVRVVKAARTLLDFLYLAQFPSHTSDTLKRLDDSLARFHHNKSVFVDLGLHRDFNILKLHSLIHYQTSISLFGTVDNYNTEQSKHLHIDFAKNAYRTTNRRDQYPQMTAWLERHKKVQEHSLVMNWQQWVLDHPQAIRPPQIGIQSLKMSVKPSVRGVSFEDLIY